MSKTDLWNSVYVTDPSAVKAITGKQYKGNSPKPYWLIQRATETFGPCGIGWGVEVANERIETFQDGTALHIALVRVWYKLDGERGVIEQMGQTKAAYTTKNGFMVDEDAPKKSVTDGMVKCLSMLGFAGDIFSGRWDDSNYVQWAQEETARRTNPAISDEQAATLKGLMQEVEADTVQFLGWIGDKHGCQIPSIDAIPATLYGMAEKALLTKKAKKAKESKNESA